MLKRFKAVYFVVAAVFAIAGLMLMVGCGSKGFNLVAKGKSAYAIVLSSQASPSETFAANELQKFIKLSTKVELPIVAESDPRAKEPARVIIGECELANSLLKDKPVDWKTLGEDGFAIKAVPGKGGTDLIIAGGNVRGTLHAVYTMLDDLGFRWYNQKKTVYPETETLKVAMYNLEFKPVFMSRDPYISESYDEDWAARNRLTLGMGHTLDAAHGGSVRIYGGHSFGQFIPYSLFKDHPEYFPLIGGKRVTGYVQRCLSNPEVVKVAADNLMKFMAEHPEEKIFSLSQEDCVNYCECPNCKKIMDEQGAPSGLYVDFTNKVADIVKEKYPDKYISTFAYWFTENAPKDIKTRDNVIIRMCPITMCESHPVSTCSDTNSVNMYKNLQGWAKLTKNIFIWHYVTDFRNLQMPFPDFKEICADIKTYRDNSVSGIFMQGTGYGPGGSDSDLRAWVLARMLWNPDLDGDAVINEYLHAVYGKAYEPMRAYFDLMQSRVADPNAHLHVFDMVTKDMWPDNVVASMDSLHEVALTLATDDSIATYYIKKNRMSVMFLQYILNTGTLTVKDGYFQPEGNTKTIDDYNKYMDYIKQFGVVALREDDSNTTLFNLLRQRVEKHQVATIENDALKIEAVPELGGRLVSIIYKKTGENILARFAPTYNYYPASGGYEDLTDGPKSNPAKHDVVVKGNTITLTGMRDDNLLFTKTITLPPKGAKINFVSTITNKNKTPNTFRLVCRANYAADPNQSEFTVRQKEREVCQSGTFLCGRAFIPFVQTAQIPL